MIRNLYHELMNRHWIPFIILLALALVVWLVVQVGGEYARDSAVSGPIYSVSQLSLGLRQNPRAWAGRTVRVQGIAALATNSGESLGVTWDGQQMQASFWLTYSFAGGGGQQLIGRDRGNKLLSVLSGIPF